MKNTLDREHLRMLLDYDQETGLFTRKFSNTRTDLIGEVAGTILNNGYIGIHIEGTLYLAHRLAFFYVTGFWPKEVDHSNGNRSDNRWKNLRDVTRTQNAQNSRGKSKSGLPKGVERASDPRRIKPFAASICANGKRYSLGYFATTEEAHAAYCEAAIKFHGEFARVA